MKNIIVTGIAGSGEREYFEKFTRYCSEHGLKVNIISITEAVVEAARKSNPNVNRYNLLSFPKTTREAWYQNAFNSILQEKLVEDAVNIVSIHISYWWKNGPEQVIRADILNSFLNAVDSIFYVQIIDSVIRIKERLNKVAEHVGMGLMEEDIFRWQDIEYYLTITFAQINKKNLYVIAAGQPADTLYRLILDEKTLKIYVSFPMTHLKNKSERRKIEEFVEKLNRTAIVFNPASIEDYQYFTSGTLKVLSGEMTVKRDYRLIDQSDMVVAYFPRVIHSSGVMLEMDYASSTAKPVYLIWPSKEYSPFTIYPVRKIFFSIEDCLAEVSTIAERKKEQ